MVDLSVNEPYEDYEESATFEPPEEVEIIESTTTTLLSTTPLTTTTTTTTEQETSTMPTTEAIPYVICFFLHL